MLGPLLARDRGESPPLACARCAAALQYIAQNNTPTVRNQPLQLYGNGCSLYPYDRVPIVWHIHNPYPPPVQLYVLPTQYYPISPP